MEKTSDVTVSFKMDRDLYNRYKSIVASKGQYVKDNLVKYMLDVARYETPNADTIQAIREVQELKKDPNVKIYDSFDEILAEI